MKITLMSCQCYVAYQIQQEKKQKKKPMKTSLVKDSELLNELLQCLINLITLGQLSTHYLR